MESPAFKDHFSGHADDYARYRPRYPRELFVYLASLCVEHALAWDCGTGNGQAALGLAPHFDRVIATDASAGQLARAASHERITYIIAPAEKSPLAPASADLVTVAQAVHWFDFELFYGEVRRVLKPAGLLAVWTYSLFEVSPAVDEVVHTYYREVINAYWPPERRFVEAAYRTLPFPFDELGTPPLYLEEVWDLGTLTGYLGTWSATRRFMQDRGANPVDLIRTNLETAWGPARDKKAVRWSLHMRVGRRVA